MIFLDLISKTNEKSCNENVSKNQCKISKYEDDSCTILEKCHTESYYKIKYNENKFCNLFSLNKINLNFEWLDH